MALVIKGSSSGQVTVDVPAAAGTNTLTLPAGTGNIITSTTAGTIIQVVNSISSTPGSNTTTMPFDSTIPQNNEGAEFTTVAITAANSSNKFHVSVFAQLSQNASTGRVVAALFIDSTANALAAGACQIGNTGGLYTVAFDYIAAAGDTSEHTFKLRYGKADGSTAYINKNAAGFTLGGVATSGIIVREIAV